MNKWLYYSLHIALYYAIWISCVLAAAQGHGFIVPMCAIILTLFAIMYHCHVANDKGHFIRFIITLVIVGMVVDTIMLNTGLLIYHGNVLVYIAPLWILAMWLDFSVVFYITCQFLFNRWLLLATLALIAFPLTYYIGVLLGAASINHWLALPIIGIAWAIVLPIMCKRMLQISTA